MNSVTRVCNVARGFLLSKRIYCGYIYNYGGKTSPLSSCKFRALHTDKSKSKENLYIKRRNTIRNYMVAVTIMTLGFTYAAVPLYTIFCQMTGYGGATQHDSDVEKLKNLQRNPNRKITVKFNSDVAASMAWMFQPQQTEVQVVPGETALAFYTATNPTDKPIIGVSTYNVIPYDAGPYFNKIQCFCFEEQLLNPHEQVDMPVFFYIDPEYSNDPRLENVDEIILSYTFFEAKEGLNLPIPGFLKNH